MNVGVALANWPSTLCAAIWASMCVSVCVSVCVCVCLCVLGVCLAMLTSWTVGAGAVGVTSQVMVKGYRCGLKLMT